MILKIFNLLSIFEEKNYFELKCTGIYNTEVQLTNFHHSCGSVIINNIMRREAEVDIAKLC